MTKDTILSTKGFSPQQEAWLFEAAGLFGEAINTDEFRTETVNHKWKNEKGIWVPGYYYSNLTGQQVYDRYMGAGEYGDNKEQDQNFEIKVELYNSPEKVVGKTYTNKLIQWINERYFVKATPPSRAGSIGHEKSHQLDLQHPREWNPFREFSAPYAIGYLIERIATKIYRKRQIKPQAPKVQVTLIRSPTDIESKLA